MLLSFIIAFIIGTVFGFVTTRYSRYKIAIAVLAILLVLALIFADGGSLVYPETAGDWYEFCLGFVGVLFGMSIGEWYAKKRMNRLPTV